MKFFSFVFQHCRVFPEMRPRTRLSLSKSMQLFYVTKISHPELEEKTINLIFKSLSEIIENEFEFYAFLLRSK